MRRLLILLLIFLGVIFLVSNLARLEEVWSTFAKGDWRVLSACVLLVGVWLINLAATYRVIYRSLGVKETLWDLLVVASSAAFANIVTPSGVVGGVALFINQATSKGYSQAKATLAGVLHLVFDLIAFAAFLIVGLAVLLRRGDLSPAEISASIVLLGIAGVLVFLIVLGIRSRDELSGALLWIARRLNRVIRIFTKRTYLDEDEVVRFGHEAADGLALIRKRPSNLIWPSLLALNNKAVLLVIFWLIFIAFQAPHSVGTIVAGFSLMFLFTIVSPSPSGIGIVEGVMPFALRTLNVPLQSGTVITLAYRGLTFWLPLLWGMISLRLLK